VDGSASFPDANAALVTAGAVWMAAGFVSMFAAKGLSDPVRALRRWTTGTIIAGAAGFAITRLFI
jgi:hypothetical protein